MPLHHPLLSIIGFACLSVAAVYTLLTVAAVLVTSGNEVEAGQMLMRIE